MCEDTYGEAFLRNLRAINRHSSFDYAERQTIKPMQQCELAEWLRERWPELADPVRYTPPDVAAKLCYELAAAMAIRKTYESRAYMRIIVCAVAILISTVYLILFN